ncbi:MAG: glycosyltransferase family 4 protein, partial [Alphaproteobacteria bacterium]|nr:glycosyltransferase family 4 protein [Alphaproteobacteria bacterium]
MPGEPRAAPQRPLRLLVNAIHARAGGGLTYLHHILPLLAAEGDFDVHIIPHPAEAESFALPGIAVHRLAMPRRWTALLMWEQAVLPLRARQIGYDLLFSPANFGPLLIGRQVIVLQNALGVGAFERRWRKRLYWRTLRLMTRLSLWRACRAIAVSRYVAASVAALAPGRPKPVVIHHGVDAIFAPGAATSGTPFLLAVGDLYIQKNLHRLVEALALIRRRVPAMTLAIAGNAVDPGYAAALRRAVTASGLGDAVRFLGRCERRQLVKLYRDCAAFLFPSTEESFGMPLVEAMASGAPVIAAARAAMPEIADGAALLVDPDDPAAIAGAVLRVLG